MPNPQISTAPTAALTRRDLEARIIAKAWKDPNYKQRLLTNPKAVLQHEIAAIDPSVSLPAGLQVQVHEEAPNVYHLVLPRNPKDISLGELLGENLEAVAPQTIAIVVVGNMSQVVNVNAATVQAINIVAIDSFVTIGSALVVSTTVGGASANVVNNATAIVVA
jgi:Nitrile hydratase, alpha chain